MVVRITDRPVKINTGNLEQKLRKFLTVFRLIAGEIEEALEQIEKNRKHHV